MPTVGKLLVELAADTASFKQDIGRTAKLAEKNFRQIEQVPAHGEGATRD